MARTVGIHHVSFTVRDAERSKQWYEDLFGWQELLAIDDDLARTRILADLDAGIIVGLRQYLDRPDGEFDEFRTGMDHLAFEVSSLDELGEWEQRLAERGIEHTPAVATPIGTVVVFRDPDRIQLELWLPI